MFSDTLLIKSKATTLESEIEPEYTSMILLHSEETGSVDSVQLILKLGSSFLEFDLRYFGLYLFAILLNSIALDLVFIIFLILVNITSFDSSPIKLVYPIIE